MGDFINYIPPALQDLEELKAIYVAQEVILDQYETEAARQLANQFVETADEEGIENLEQRVLSITPKATDSLNDRRFRILARFNENLPYTKRRLYQQLVALCGENGFEIDRNTDEYTLTVKVELTAKNNFNDVGKLLEKMVPVNTVIDLILRYNQHTTLAQFTHAQLASHTHYQLRNEVIT